MEGLLLKKIMRKSKGKWVIVGLSTAAMSLSLQTVSAEKLGHSVDIPTELESELLIVDSETSQRSDTQLSNIVKEQSIKSEELPIIDSLENQSLEKEETVEETVIDSEVEQDKLVEESSKDNEDRLDEPKDESGMTVNEPTIAIATTMSLAKTQTHTVKSGEYLYLIGQNYGVTVQQLKEWNNLTSNYIYSGDQLLISGPAVNQPKPEETEAEKTPVSETGKYYTVRAGDYLWKIATDHGITVNQLKSWNNLTSNYIYSGDRFLVSNPKIVTPTPIEPKPEPKPQPKPEPKPTVAYYTVTPGDYLWKIATQHGITLSQLKEWNKLSSNYIYSGDRLAVSDPSKQVETGKPETESPEPDKGNEKEPETGSEDKDKTSVKYYTVKSGDYLWLIATQNGITVNQLKTWNKLTSNYIYSGDRLVVTEPNKTEQQPTIPSDSLTGTHQAVQAVLNQYKNSPIHVFYESLLEDDLRTASLSGDVAMYGASVPKVVLIAYTLDQIEKENLSWDTPLKYNSAIYNHSESYAWGGSGTIQYENYQNKSYTLKDIVYRTIAHSDNLASNMLLHYVGYRDKTDFNRFTQEVYGATSYSRTMTPREVNKVMRYIHEHPQQYAMSALDKTNYDHTKLDTVSANVFQKIGAWWPYYNHSTAIVDSKRPYVLTVLTDYWSDSSIATLAKKIFTAVMS